MDDDDDSLSWFLLELDILFRLLLCLSLSLELPELLEILLLLPDVEDEGAIFAPLLLPPKLPPALFDVDEDDEEPVNLLLPDLRCFEDDDDEDDEFNVDELPDWLELLFRLTVTDADTVGAGSISFSGDKVPSLEADS